jgi:hypothetical protein
MKKNDYYLSIVDTNSTVQIKTENDNELGISLIFK